MQLDADGALAPSLTDAEDERWLADFHAGRRAALERCYRECYGTVHRAVGRVLSGPDQETVVHEVFYQLLSREALRRSFQGGSLKAWLATVAVHLATDYVRRQRREQNVLAAVQAEGPDAPAPAEDGAAEARALVERFRAELLPKKWERVFEARFLRQLSQRDAAQELGMHRTTLAYQELRIRALLSRFARQLGREP